MRLLGGSVAVLWVVWVFDVFLHEVRFSLALPHLFQRWGPGLTVGPAAADVIAAGGLPAVVLRVNSLIAVCNPILLQSRTQEIKSQ